MDRTLSTTVVSSLPMSLATDSITWETMAVYTVLPSLIRIFHSYFRSWVLISMKYLVWKIYLRSHRSSTCGLQMVSCFALLIRKVFVLHLYFQLFLYSLVMISFFPTVSVVFWTLYGKYNLIRNRTLMVIIHHIVLFQLDQCTAFLTISLFPIFRFFVMQIKINLSGGALYISFVTIDFNDGASQTGVWCRTLSPDF